MVLGQALRLVAAGIVLSLLLAGLAMRFIKGTPPADPVVYAAVACIFLIVARGELFAGAARDASGPGDCPADDLR